MATRIAADATIPSGFAEVPREPRIMRISNAEEGDSRGEGWVFLRAVTILVAAIVGVGWLIS